jgi:hypothetical protein
MITLQRTMTSRLVAKKKNEALSVATTDHANASHHQLSASTPNMPPLIRRILLFRPSRPPNRLLTQLRHSRPQLPFLSQPRPSPRQIRFFTTDRKAWLKDELKKAVRYTATGWLLLGLLVTIALGVQQEWLERKFPSPHEWSWATRMNFRSARWEEDHDDDEKSDVRTDWANAGGYYRDLLMRLENLEIDGAGLEEQDEGGILVAGIGKTGYDISKKPESWRRGYYQVLMGAARAAEHLDGWVRDRTRNIAFPANVVIGPSNPNPRPVPPGGASAPKEEDCDAAFEPPETYYMRVLTTRGFTEKQRLDAALAYATWLDYKGTPDAAEDMFKWALDIASSSSPNPKSIISPSGTLNPTAEPPSANILSATTALAIHHARTSNFNLALPIFLSVLRSRRSLVTSPPKNPSTPLPSDEDSKSGPLSIILSALAPPTYPPPPPDGTSPPPRDAVARCEEAALMAYIGEIFYATASGSTQRQIDAGRDEGLAWTREAVDIAEEVLRSSSTGTGTGSENSNSNGKAAGMETGTGKELGKEAKKICSQCLETGLGNWAKMVERLAKEERERREERETLERSKSASEILRSADGRGAGVAAGAGLGWLGWASSAGLGDMGRSEVGTQGPQGKAVVQKEKEKERIPGRWESEEIVVRERIRRARDVLGAAVVPSGGGMFMI